LQPGTAFDEAGDLLIYFGDRAGEVLKHIIVEGGAYDVCCALSFLKLSDKGVIRNNGGLEEFDLNGDVFAELRIGVCRRRFTDGTDGTG
jgi:hypothetical protein